MEKIVNIFIFLILGLSFSFGGQNNQISDMIKHYEGLFNSLDKARKGLSDKELSQSVDPFISIKNTPIVTYDQPSINLEQEPEYALYAILNNKAKINDTWYSIGDDVRGYKLNAILKNSVKLTKNNETLTLNLVKGNENVIISDN
ncbi:hypothetical protein CSPB12327_07095 [Campylobacter sp. RM12327]|uniref:hypothetical protein n=1 Tax=Campylobacter sputorum TaxID=206 RepID=UPI000B7836F9|nr:MULTISPECIES: hypothetical protein [Campylobacter]ASM40144.1 hypothetical protein CSPB_0927 [Campylobacter sputorum]MBE7358560.1 hypothetical protein [Campylobacter sp. RM11302]MBF6669902.1 hypothetical protein [Campylobacter sp. RM12327]MBF6675158.1 hypothetical protein [Campylobacter sp. RM13538]MBF6676420.1 hypothetical protein [Campylobacter sp. RM12321]